MQTLRGSDWDAGEVLEMDGGDGYSGVNALNAAELHTQKWIQWSIFRVFYHRKVPIP